ncbi:hypothetical protein [Falsiroseomonas sp. HW251]|uniref:hypothetical protein n=1 Tax=Falsiroseomonas sp. HW251 TaxID=3390998 RepID=UPI003D3201BC
MDGIFASFRNPDTAIVFEDDGRVAYAYWIGTDGRANGDVWLYNRLNTPVAPEWKDRSKAPFPNPLAYARTTLVFTLPEAAADVGVVWSADGKEARVVIGGVTAGVLEAGAKPGRAAMAAKDGPMARCLAP